MANNTAVGLVHVDTWHIAPGYMANNTAVVGLVHVDTWHLAPGYMANDTAVSTTPPGYD